MKQPSKDSPLDGVPKLMTFAEAGERLGVCDRTIRGHVDRGELAHIALGRGTVRRRRMIHPDDLRAFIDSMRRRGDGVPTAHIAGKARRQRPAEPASTYQGSFLEMLAKERAQKAKGPTSAPQRRR